MEIGYILEKIKVIQKKQFKNSLGKKYYVKRLNPYNPISYLTIVVISTIGIILFGVIGFWREINLRDFTFKYR